MADTTTPLAPGVIRRPHIGSEPMLLQTAHAMPRPAIAAAPAGDALRAHPAAGLPAAVPLPPSLATRAIAPVGPDAADVEADARRALEAEREIALRQATEAGMAAGLAAGQEAGRAEWTERSARLEALLGSVHGELVAGIAGQEDLLVELAFESVLRILGQTAVTRDGVRGLVREAIGSLREREQVLVRLATADADLLRDMHGEMTRLAGIKGLEIVADDSIALGGCLLETARGGLDARLETQVQRLRELLLAARRGEAAP